MRLLEYTLVLFCLFLIAQEVAAAVDVSSLPWNDLRVALSSPDRLTMSSIEAWKSQCVSIFQAESFPGGPNVVEAELVNGSNWQLIDQPAGLCADMMACVWKECDWAPVSTFELLEMDPSPTRLIDFYDADAVDPEHWNLPAAVVHAGTVGDIKASMDFATEHGIGMSVKTSGHSYTGSHTDKDSLMINMRQYPKYARAAIEDSLIECVNVSTANVNLTDPAASFSTAHLRAAACEVAQARGWSAILRVGGGEVWSEVYLVLSNWNAAQEAWKYHIVGGAAGTVGAAGGYLFATGLSGTTGMRMFGYAVDQVTQMEMVLPTGDHVRFGPTSWEADPSLHFPRTTKVTGWCNLNPSEPESGWTWQVCSNDIDFYDLWHAVRGGGGGFGIVTSVEYQLPDYPGELTVFATSPLLAQTLPSLFAEACGSCEEATALMDSVWADFVIDYFWNPQSLNVSDQATSLCGGPSGFSISTALFAAGEINVGLGFCYGDGFKSLAAAWETRLSEPSVRDALLEAALTSEIIDAVSTAIYKLVALPDYAQLSLRGGTKIPGVPLGSLPDSPRPFSNYIWSSNTFLVPKKFVVEQKEQSIPWMNKFALAAAPYMMGGFISSYHDGTTATNPLYRESAFYTERIRLVPIEYLEAILQYNHGDGTPQENFPGGAEYNHMQPWMYGPLKTNWSQPCPPETSTFTDKDRQENCISMLENVFGTQGMVRLESIKAAVDKNHLFNCYGCVGYREPTDEQSSDTSKASGLTCTPVMLLGVAITTFYAGGSLES